jgi:hypothetical protein
MNMTLILNIILMVTYKTKWELASTLNTVNPLCTKLIIWEDSSTCYHNKTRTEKGQLMGNPVYT